MLNAIFQGAIAGLAFLGLIYLFKGFIKLIVRLEREADDKGKRIEYAAAIAAFIAIAISVLGLVYSAVKTDDLEARVIAIESAVKHTEPASPKPGP